MKTGKYDTIIVGGGSAGCALANRLSTNPSNQVLVLEAGRPDYRWDVFIHMPAALTYPLAGRTYNWWYESEPEPHMHGRRIYQPRGKVLGGTSCINAFSRRNEALSVMGRRFGLAKPLSMLSRTACIFRRDSWIRQATVPSVVSRTTAASL